jgi:hypothetical protein
MLQDKGVAMCIPSEILKLEAQLLTEVDQVVGTFINSGKLDPADLNHLVDMKRSLDSLERDWKEGRLTESKVA